MLLFIFCWIFLTLLLCLPYQSEILNSFLGDASNMLVKKKKMMDCREYGMDFSIFRDALSVPVIKPKM